MSEPKDQIHFQQGPVVPDAGIYRTPLQNKSGKDEVLPQVSSRILNAPAVQQAYASFGLEGLKSMLLQELVRLDWPQLQDEMALLAEGANAHKVIKRGMRATKILAAQWNDDARQPEDVRQKCDYIFNAISTFGTIQIAAPETPASQMNSFGIQFPTLGPLEPVAAEAEHSLPAGSGLLLITDLQGHYERLETMLLNTQMAQLREGVLHWTAPDTLWLVVVGDIFNKSPYSTWGDGVGFDTYKLIRTLERLIKIAPERVLLSYGAQDLDLATLAALYHPVSGFMGEPLGVNAQAQAIPAVMSFIRGTAQPESPDFAWEYQADSQSFVLKDSYQVQGFPYLVLPEKDGAPDTAPLLGFYQGLYERLLSPQAAERPQNIQQIDAIASGLLPPPGEQLNLQNLATSLGRCLHYQGLLSGSGTLNFLRERIAGLHVLNTGQNELFAMHPEIQEMTLDMLHVLKGRGSDHWEPLPLDLFLQQSRVLIQRRIAAEKLMQRLQALKITQLNDWLALPEGHFYKRLVQMRQLAQWVPEIVPKQDEKGFCEAYRQLRWELINEDSSGLAGYAINMDGVSRRGEPLMRKMADLDERTRRSYAKTFLMDLFREEVQAQMNIQPEGIVIEYPDSQQPLLTLSLLVDESVAIYRDPKDSLHMPVKHAAWIERH